MYDNLLPNEPRLMPMQSRPLNGDSFACQQFLELKEKFGIKSVIELGSCVFGSTKWFAENFEKVLTVEISRLFRDIGLVRANGLNNIISYLGDSVEMLPTMLSQVDNQTIIFIDSHWQSLPLFDELKLIKQSGLTPVIVVHDCLVPDEPNLGYDSYDGVTISYQSMLPYLDAIYGEGGWDYHYNSDLTSTEIKRGIIYIYPRK
jgi:hypothetical protein